MSLPAHWTAAVSGLAAAPAAAERDALVAAWSEPHRRYHDRAHLAAVLAEIERLATAEGLDAAEARIARLAGWWHDAVYRPGSDDEADSAAWAERAITAWGEPDLAGAVARAVLATRDHQATRPAEAVLVDADLAVLAGPPDAYERYRSATRAEYAHVPDDAWRSGRAAVLRRLLDRARLFHTPTGAAREDAARANLAAELAAL